MIDYKEWNMDLLLRALEARTRRRAKTKIAGVFFVDRAGGVAPFRKCRASVGPAMTRYEDGSTILSVAMSAAEISAAAPTMFIQPQIINQAGA